MITIKVKDQRSLDLISDSGRVYSNKRIGQVKLYESSLREQEKTIC